MTAGELAELLAAYPHGFEVNVYLEAIGDETCWLDIHGIRQVDYTLGQVTLSVDDR